MSLQVYAVRFRATVEATMYVRARNRDDAEEYAEDHVDELDFSYDDPDDAALCSSYETDCFNESKVKDVEYEDSEEEADRECCACKFSTRSTKDGPCAVCGIWSHDQWRPVTSDDESIREAVSV